MSEKRLYSPSYVREILEKYGFRFSKSLGQNFLIDGNIVRKICEEGNIKKEDNVLEIGPGIGTLTEELSLRAKSVISVEIDKNLLPILDETLKNCPNVEIVYGDILDIDLNKLFKEKFETGDIKVVANLPYYVTTPIIAKLLEDDLDIHSIVVMVQKEVADRIVAGPGNKQYSSLSVFAQYYTNPEVILKVPKTVFMPRPKVDSAVVKLTLKRDNENIANKELFFKIVRAAFGKRRKTLLNALASGDLKVTKDELREILRNAEIDPKERAENLTVEDFIKISSIFPPLDIY